VEWNCQPMMRQSLKVLFGSLALLCKSLLFTKRVYFLLKRAGEVRGFVEEVGGLRQILFDLA